MANHGDDAPDGYKVGYRRPPKASQFQPGQSGNRRGRPKGSRSFGQIFREVMGGKVSITKNGKTRAGSAVEGLVERLFSDALRGDRAAVRDALTGCERYFDPDEGAARLEDLLAEDQEILLRYAADIAASSKAQGLEETPSPGHDEESGDDGPV